MPQVTEMTQEHQEKLFLMFFPNSTLKQSWIEGDCLIINGNGMYEAIRVSPNGVRAFWDKVDYTFYPAIAGEFLKQNYELEVNYAKEKTTTS